MVHPSGTCAASAGIEGLQVVTQQIMAPRGRTGSASRHAEARRAAMLLIVAAILPSGAAQQNFVALCGFSKVPLSQDLTRRFCLRQCIIDQDVIRPVFSEWETYCRETAAMEDWDPDCERFFSCTFGCDVYGNDRSAVSDIEGAARQKLLIETRDNMLSEGITQDLRCQLQKCRSYCAREAFDTCREMQFTESCKASRPELYGCNVDCDGSFRSHPAAMGLLPLGIAILAALATDQLVSL